MKKLITIFVSYLILLVLTGCTKNIEKHDEEVKEVSSLNKEVEVITSSKGRLNICVNLNIELLSIVQYLSDYDENTGLMATFDFEYKTEVEDYFGPYRDHEVVSYFSKISKEGFDFHRPPGAMLYLDDQMELREGYEISDDIVKNAGGEEGIHRFFQLLKAFSEDSNSNEFFQTHRSYYEKIIDNTLNVIEDRDYIAEIESYYGKKQNSYNVVLVSLYHSGGFAHKIKVSDNNYDIYSVCGPMKIEGTPHFGSEKIFRHLQRHEFGHSFVNYLTDIHSDEVMKYSELYEPIRKSMSQIAYSTWESCVNEHIIRAITTSMAFKDSEDEGRIALKYEQNLGFVYVEDLLAKLKDYEENRDKYETFEDFYPDLIMSFNKYLDDSNLSTSKAKFDN